MTFGDIFSEINLDSSIIYVIILTNLIFLASKLGVPTLNIIWSFFHDHDIKDLSKIVTNKTTRIFQTSLDEGTVPKDWRKTNIVPIFKKVDKSKPANYRPVSLNTAICSKILEHIIYSNIMNHLSQNNLLSDNQHGFRARQSCETQLITTVQEQAKNMSSGKQIDVILLDFSKAFDKVPHRRLLMKLDHYWQSWYNTEMDTRLSYRTYSTGTARRHTLLHLWCRLWGAPGHGTRTTVVLHIHQWLARICHIKCTTIRWWLPPLSCD